MNEKARPGVMLYFDKILPARERLSSESLGDLLNGISLTQKVNLTQEQDLSINRQRGGEQEGELEDCKGEKEGGLLMPRYVPLSESEEQARRSAALKALQNYPN